MADSRLNRQVERILDEVTGRQAEVIVRMKAPTDDEEKRLMEAISETMRRRVLSTSARDVLPVDETILRSPRRRVAAARAPRSLFNADRSLVAQTASAAVSQRAVAGMQRIGLDALRPLLQADVMRRRAAAGAVRGAQRPRGRDTSARLMWSSSSAVVALSRDELARLPQAVPQIGDIYPNRRLFVPPVVRPASLPLRTDDNGAAAWGIRTIGALSSWGAYGFRGEGVTIGLLDTGVDATHPDLRGKIAHWAELDARGRLVAGSTPHDSDVHGTHCAGTLVGGNASGRWIGVAPDARLAAAMVLNGARGGTDAQVLGGIEWAIDRAVDVISMSLGGLTLGPEVPSTYTSAILKALRLGIPVVTAVGNEGSQTSGSPANDLFAFAVGATDDLDRVAGFSGGRTQMIRESEYFPPDALPIVYSKPEVTAPGVAVYSSVPGGRWEHYNGTSMATPHAAGAIALLLSATDIRRKVAAQDRAFLVQDLVTGSVEEMGESGQDHRYGFGRIDILRAIGFAREKGFGPGALRGPGPAGPSRPAGRRPKGTYAKRRGRK